MVIAESETARLQGVPRAEVSGSSLVPAYDVVMQRFIGSIALGPAGKTVELTIESTSQFPVIGEAPTSASVGQWVTLANSLFDEPKPQTREERQRLESVYLARAGRIEVSGRKR
jgi:hypothetical protein